ncbi:unnamed protein product [Colias eurytheme]|nr:unnamed protein product [Colias eurytheme]
MLAAPLRGRGPALWYIAPSVGPRNRPTFVKPDEVAKLWGQMKQNDNMTFEKFSRAMRYHYRQSVLVSVPTARLVYQFGHKGPDFRTDNPNFVKVKSELDVHDMTFSNS